MIHCPYCDELIDDEDVFLDEDIPSEDQARFGGFLAGRAGDGREAPEDVVAATSNVTSGKRREINHQWLIGYDAGASVRTAIEARERQTAAVNRGTTP